MLPKLRRIFPEKYGRSVIKKRFCGLAALGQSDEKALAIPLAGGQARVVLLLLSPYPLILGSRLRKGRRFLGTTACSLYFFGVWKKSGHSKRNPSEDSATTLNLSLTLSMSDNSMLLWNRVILLVLPC